MPDIERIYSSLLHMHWTWTAAPRGVQYYFEANIFSWGFIHV